METIFKVLIAFVVVIFVLVLLPRFLIARQFSDKTIMQETKEVYYNTRDKVRSGMGLKTGTQRELALEKKRFTDEMKKLEREERLREAYRIMDQNRWRIR